MSKHTSKTPFTLHKLRRYARKLFVRRQYRDELFRYIFASNKKFMLSLSDAFEKPDRADIEPCLECRATVYNIHHSGHNKELMQRCRPLEEFDMKEFLSMTKRDEQKEGYEAGVAAGMERGRAAGIEQGRSEGVPAFISTCQDLGLSKEHTAARLIDKFHFSQEKAATLLAQHLEKIRDLCRMAQIPYFSFTYTIFSSLLCGF